MKYLDLYTKMEADEEGRITAINYEGNRRLVNTEDDLNDILRTNAVSVMVIGMIWPFALLWVVCVKLGERIGHGIKAKKWFPKKEKA